MKGEINLSAWRNNRGVAIWTTLRVPQRSNKHVINLGVSRVWQANGWKIGMASPAASGMLTLTDNTVHSEESPVGAKPTALTKLTPLWWWLYAAFALGLCLWCGGISWILR